MPLRPLPEGWCPISDDLPEGWFVPVTILPEDYFEEKKVWVLRVVQSEQLNMEFK